MVGNIKSQGQAHNHPIFKNWVYTGQALFDVSEEKHQLTKIFPKTEKEHNPKESGVTTWI